MALLAVFVRLGDEPTLMLPALLGVGSVMPIDLVLFC